MCAAAINLTSKALNDVNNAEVLLKIKTFISLFIQTMEVSKSATILLATKLTVTGMGLFCFHTRCFLTETIRQVRRATET